MQLEDTLLSLLYDSAICVNYMCEPNSPEAKERLILLQTHVEYIISLSPSMANKTFQPLTCESIEKMSIAQQWPNAATVFPAPLTMSQLPMPSGEGSPVQSAAP